MPAIAVAASLVRKWEGCQLAAYPDPATGGAPWTIGWGATGPGITKGTVWTQTQADQRLEQDVAKFVTGVSALLKRKPTDNQLGAMASLAYNIGLGNFGKSTLLRLFNAGDIDGAAKQFAVWRMANGKVMQGLINRRADERKVFETP
ncbi:lysozyme [Xanthomonas sp. LMG 12461]|uniref:lysozyme n=1 Tax=Xanthomonas sp. LMG 12461 TaxID=2014543 RepID=UPI001264C639|nr:lysozyme [Xanthomonas sp. LMG 12461]KAB7765388.1 lysozyme [Xanthomonas sp. LMG 12461]